MIIKQILKEAEEKLKKAKVPSAKLDAEVLLMYTLRKSREWIYLNNEKEITTQEIGIFNKLISKRTKRIPLAYIINNKEFYGTSFYIDRNVLIPRPETERLIELALSKMLKTNKKLGIAEIGIGSGCISAVLALELLKNKKDFYIYATDISKKAINVANRNLIKHKLKKYVKVKKEDILKTNNRFDFIISNPPYVPKKIKLEKELEFEPKEALFPKKGFIDEFLKNALAHLKNGGTLFIEIDPSWVKDIEVLKLNKEIEYIEFEKDIRQFTRYATIKKRL